MAGDDEQPVRVRLAAVVFDASAPDVLGAFWARALRWEVAGDGPFGVEVVPTDETELHLVFRPSRAGEKRTQNPIHLDLTTTSPRDQERSVSDLLALGAQPADVGQGPDATHVVLADPEGNELCLIAPGNRFLATCPRLGAVNCDGTKELGQFYSAALAWPLVWDHDEETAVQAPTERGPKVTWSGPPLLAKSMPERVHLHVAAAPGSAIEDAAARLVDLGARRLPGQVGCPGATALADVDGNVLCLVDS